MKDASIVPVVAVSAATGVGIARMLDLMAKYFPSPAHNEPVLGVAKIRARARTSPASASDDQPFSAFVSQDHR